MNKVINRKIIWLSSLNEKNKNFIDTLEKRLKNFYINNPDYYKNIDFTSVNWINKDEPCYKNILETVVGKSKILEVGCGSANILYHFPEVQHKYSGCDFSRDLIEQNSLKYPHARFKTISQSNVLPYDDGQFDLVFSVFVIEHSANPALLLKECTRVLKENGQLVILCPDFLGGGRMSSQRAGFSRGTSSDKLKQSKYLDALVTLIDNRIKIPLYCKYLTVKSFKSPKFYINVNPTVFSDTFIPDVDAVYITSRQEMIFFLKENMDVIKNSLEICRYEREHKLIYLKFRKMSSNHGKMPSE